MEHHIDKGFKGLGCGTVKKAKCGIVLNHIFNENDTHHIYFSRFYKHRIIMAVDLECQVFPTSVFEVWVEKYTERTELEREQFFDETGLTSDYVHEGLLFTPAKLLETIFGVLMDTNKIVGMTAISNQEMVTHKFTEISAINVASNILHKSCSNTLFTRIDDILRGKYEMDWIKESKNQMILQHSKEFQAIMLEYYK